MVLSIPFRPKSIEIVVEESGNDHRRFSLKKEFSELSRFPYAQESMTRGSPFVNLNGVTYKLANEGEISSLTHLNRATYTVVREERASPLESFDPKRTKIRVYSKTKFQDFKYAALFEIGFLSYYDAFLAGFEFGKNHGKHFGSSSGFVLPFETCSSFSIKFGHKSKRDLENTIKGLREAFSRVEFFNEPLGGGAPKYPIYCIMEPSDIDAIVPLLPYRIGEYFVAGDLKKEQEKMSVTERKFGGKVSGDCVHRGLTGYTLESFTISEKKAERDD